ncbi:MAG: ATP-binding domain-containing protein [Actinomycetota bacterium]
MSNEDVDLEQGYVSMLYGRLDELRERASGRLASVLQQTGGTHQARTEREVFSYQYSQQVAQFDAAENRLCFGRLDFQDGERRYIGRLGIHADSGEYEQLLMDWRASAARPFYLATAVSPEDVTRRRHIEIRDRKVTSLDDEILDLASADPDRHDGLTGESALLAAMNATRTGRMSDIVETIQAEQDHIIRSELPGVLVVQGGPGTGKTAVALHRAAFLLYTHRRQLLKRGVLVVGPNLTFLRYIGQVLPSLGETSVMLSTMAGLYPGITATATEPPEAAVLKGGLAMARVIAAAVRDRQQVPEDGLEVMYDRDRFVISKKRCHQARERARRSRRPHNQARQVFAREMIDALTEQAAARIGTDVLGGSNLLDDVDVAELRQELRADAGVRAAIDWLWPAVTPQELVSALFADPERLASAAPGLSDAGRDLLRREPGGGWTPADVPLLDEAAELLGEDDSVAKALAARARRQAEAYAQGVLDIMARDDDDDPEILMGADLVDASRLAARAAEEQYLTAAERAADDRTWAFGHVIVDEAQELSQMAWRMLMRRCPVRSMTIVGDVAQTGDQAGARSWDQVLGPYLQDRWRLAELTINYRTPSEIMAVAADVLAAIDPELELPRSVRESGSPPWHLQAPNGELAGTLAAAAARMAMLTGKGRLGLIVPAGQLPELSKAVAAELPAATGGDDPELESPVVVLSVRQAKGLEFDSVLIADPAQILADSPRGLNDLYVAMTRSTQRLGVVHTGDLPKVLARLDRASSVPAIG